ncbi:hypothetical protein [Galbibacter pacificus]|uniref:Uncharacterized protein n=1 Tax=Galbibacter pacificus TaxID=2996052 RepID=A0ABT6FQF7_9FLAO|nr:hypothetical protein [Galbibacter pacificus]MDG3582066.1 hypothetical protein [Galbibacter pacificus]MDG3585460.1 hypothetical protein [Galbibacter pacificus]
MMNITTSYVDMYNRIHTKTHATVGKIKDLIENEDISASDELYTFLKEIEDTFRRNKISAFTDIATYRIDLLSSRIALDQRVPQKSHQLEKAMALIPDITKTVHEALRPIKNRINESRVIIKELISQAYDSNMVQYHEATNFSDFINALWRLLLNHDNFKTKAITVSQSITNNDILYILAEEVHPGKKPAPKKVVG